MSRIGEEEVRCPECNHVEMATIFYSINVSVDPNLKQKLFENQINVFECKNCGAFRTLDIDWLYHDMEKNIWIWVQHSDGNLREEMEKQEKKLRPEDLAEYLEGRKARIVNHRVKLIEKIQIFDDDLDDIVIECLKLLSHVRYSYIDGADLSKYDFLYVGLNEESDLYFKLFSTDGDERYIPVKFKLYESVINSLKSLPGWEEGIGSDWLTVDTKYVMERFDASQLLQSMA